MDFFRSLFSKFYATHELQVPPEPENLMEPEPEMEHEPMEPESESMESEPEPMEPEPEMETVDGNDHFYIYVS
jgi:hypothetical protein